MPLIRAILNNGFFFIVLIVATAVYLAYSDNVKRDHGLLPNQSSPVAEASSTDNIEDVSKTIDNQDIQKSNLAESELSTSQDAEVPRLENNDESTVELSTESTENQPETSTAENVLQLTDDQNATSKTNTQTNEISTGALETDTPPEEQILATNSNDSIAPIEDTPSANDITENAESKTASNNLQDDTMSDSEIKSNLKPLEFANQNEAIQTAKEATKAGDHLTAANIYSYVAKKSPSANIVGEVALSLSQAGKQEAAEQAWLQSAKMLVAENRMQEAAMLSSRLAYIAPKVSQEIQMNLQKIHYQRMQERNKQMAAQIQKQSQPMFHQNAQKMQPMAQQPQQSMPPMQPMPNYAPMKPMAPMPHMQKMQPMAQQPQQNMLPMQPMPNMKPMPNYVPMKPMAPMPHMQKMQPMAQQPQQNMLPMQPMPNMKPMPNYAPMKPMAPMPPMQKMQPMAQQPQQNMPPMNSQPNPALAPLSRFNSPSYKPYSNLNPRYQAYLAHLKRQHVIMRNRMPAHSYWAPQYRPQERVSL